MRFKAAGQDAMGSWTATRRPTSPSRPRLARRQNARQVIAQVRAASPQKTPAKSKRASRKTGKTSRALINTPPIWVTMQKFTRSLWGRASSIERAQRRHARAALHADDRRGVPAAERQVRTASPICVAQIAGQLRTSASQTHRPEALMAFGPPPPHHSTFWARGDPARGIDGKFKAASPLLAKATLPPPRQGAQGAAPAGADWDDRMSSASSGSDSQA